jgi:hypothetical protein
MLTGTAFFSTYPKSFPSTSEVSGLREQRAIPKMLFAGRRVNSQVGQPQVNPRCIE